VAYCAATPNDNRNFEQFIFRYHLFGSGLPKPKALAIRAAITITKPTSMPTIRTGSSADARIIALEVYYDCCLRGLPPLRFLRIAPILA
jgi:hypothetical protein